MLNPFIPFDVQRDLFRFLGEDALDETLILAGRNNETRDEKTHPAVEQLFAIRISLIPSPRFQEVSEIFFQMLENQPWKNKITLPSQRVIFQKGRHRFWFKGGELSLKEEFAKLSPLQQRRIIQGTWNLLKKVNRHEPFQEEYQAKMRNLFKAIPLYPLRQLRSRYEPRLRQSHSYSYRHRPGKIARIGQTVLSTTGKALSLGIFLSCDLIYLTFKISKAVITGIKHTISRPQDLFSREFDPVSWEERWMPLSHNSQIPSHASKRQK